MSDQSKLTDLHLVSERFIALDGLDATRIRTDEEAANLVLDSAWLAERDKRMKAEGWSEACKGLAWCFDHGSPRDALPYLAEHNPFTYTSNGEE